MELKRKRLLFKWWIIFWRRKGKEYDSNGELEFGWNGKGLNINGKIEFEIINGNGKV